MNYARQKAEEIKVKYENMPLPKEITDFNDQAAAIDYRNAQMEKDGLSQYTSAIQNSIAPYVIRKDPSGTRAFWAGLEKGLVTSVPFVGDNNWKINLENKGPDYATSLKNMEAKNPVQSIGGNLLGQVPMAVLTFGAAASYATKIPAVNAIKNPFLKGIVADAIGNTIVSSPQIIYKGIKNKDGIIQIAKDVAIDSVVDAAFGTIISGVVNAKAIKQTLSDLNLGKIKQIEAKKIINAEFKNAIKNDETIAKTLRNKSVQNADDKALAIKTIDNKTNHLYNKEDVIQPNSIA